MILALERRKIQSDQHGSASWDWKAQVVVKSTSLDVMFELLDDVLLILDDRLDEVSN